MIAMALPVASLPVTTRRMGEDKTHPLSGS
jgi:hypothetical protein